MGNINSNRHGQAPETRGELHMFLPSDVPSLVTAECVAPVPKAKTGSVVDEIFQAMTDTQKTVMDVQNIKKL